MANPWLAGGDLFENIADDAVAADCVEGEEAALFAGGVVGKRIAQGSAGAEEADADALFGDVESFGGLRGVHAFDFAQDEDGADVVGEGLDEALEKTGELGVGGGLFGVARG